MVLPSTSCSLETAVLSCFPVCGLLSQCWKPLKYIVMFLSSSWFCSPLSQDSVLWSLNVQRGAQGATALSTTVAAAWDLTRCQLSTEPHEALGSLKGTFVRRLWADCTTEGSLETINVTHSPPEAFSPAPEYDCPPQGCLLQERGL